MRLGGKRASSRRGFTLIEILLVISLIVLLAGVLVTGGPAMFSPKDKSPKEAVREALDKVRRQALLGNQNLSVTWEKADKDGTGSLVARDGAKEVARYGIKGGSDRFTIGFLSTSKKSSFTLIGGELNENGEAQSVTYFSDGTCTPYRLQLKYADSSDVITIDPWTCAPVIKERKENAR